MGIRDRVRDYFDPHCAHVDCGGSLRGDDLTLPVTLSDEAASTLGRRRVEFHAGCADGLLVGGDVPWEADQGAINRALGLVPPASADREV